MLPGGAPRRARRGVLRRWFIAVLPVVVWLAAIGGAVELHRRGASSGALVGYAGHDPITLAHPEAAVAREVHVRAFERVVAGQVLITLDDRAERIELAGVEADVERLRAEVDAAAAQQRADNARAGADMGEQIRSFAIDREAAHVAWLSAMVDNAFDQALLRGREIELGIESRLHERGDSSFRELHRLETEVLSLRSRITENVAALDRMREAFEAADRRWAVFAEAAEVEVDIESTIAPLRLAIEVRARDVQQLVRRIDALVLRAPADGQITLLAAQPGDRLIPGTPLITISPESTGEVVAYLPEHLIDAAAVGAPVTVHRVSASAEVRSFPGTVQRVSAAVVEAPPRYRTIPTRPVWGRGIVVALADGRTLSPGEAVTIQLRR
jgi:multidrug resistance efflux pump